MDTTTLPHDPLSDSAHSGHTNGMRDAVEIIRAKLREEIALPGAVKVFGLNKAMDILDAVEAGMPDRPTPAVD